MKLTITGSLGNIGKPLTKILVDAGHTVTVVTSHTDRKAEIESLGAQAAVGSLNDASFLTAAFTGSDAVFTMTPPNINGSNIVAGTTNAGHSIAEAISGSGVKRVVMLSSIGADSPVQNGPVAGLYHIEQAFNKLENVSITFLRAGYFYINLFGNIPMIKGMEIIGSNHSGSVGIPLVHPADIAVTVANELVKTPDSSEIQYVVSDYRTGDDIAAALGTAIGKPKLPWVEFTDEQSLQGMEQAGLPTEVAALYTEMGVGIKTGVMQRTFIEAGKPITGTVKLEDFATEFAAKF